MRYTHRCPKCGSDEILRIPGTNEVHGVGNNIPVSKLVRHAILVTRYACTNCGFCEEWIDAPQDMERLKERYGDPAAPNGGQ